jgi:hypothetical protein
MNIKSDAQANIIEVAKKGERDPDRLCKAALIAFQGLGDGMGRPLSR